MPTRASASTNCLPITGKPHNQPRNPNLLSCSLDSANFQWAPESIRYFGVVFSSHAIACPTGARSDPTLVVDHNLAGVMVSSCSLHASCLCQQGNDLGMRARTLHAPVPKFVEDPSYEDEVSGKGLCDQLKTSGKRTVMVEYDTWGNSYRGLVGLEKSLSTASR